MRHGQSQWNVDQTGGEDSPLTELGRMQARRVGLYLAKKFQIRALYSSSYVRARETAEIVNAVLGLGLRLEPDLREARYEYGLGLRLFENPLASIDAHPPIQPEDVSEYYASFQARVRRALERILRENEQGDVAVVSHGGTMGTIIRTLTNSHQFSVHTDNTGIHLLHWDQYRWHIDALNRVAHLLSEEELVRLPEIREHHRE